MYDFLKFLIMGYVGLMMSFYVFSVGIVIEWFVFMVKEYFEVVVWNIVLFKCVLCLIIDVIVYMEV